MSTTISPPSIYSLLIIHFFNIVQPAIVDGTDKGWVNKVYTITESKIFESSLVNEAIKVIAYDARNKKEKTETQIIDLGSSLYSSVLA